MELEPIINMFDTKDNKQIEKERKSFEIHPASLSDLPTLSEIYVEAYSAYDSDTLAESWTPEAALKMLTFFYKTQPDLFFVAKENGEVVAAMVMLIKPWWDGNHLIDGELFTRPDKERRGIGSALFRTICETAKQKYTAKACDTITLAKSEHPLSWYKRIGFTVNEDLVNITADVDTLLANLK